MAHVVGVPKRDPCRKCQMPVFLAERLTVGKKVYHRTCLRCARCGSQLTPGSFYETEVDDEYCCETCPDEEEIETEGAASSVLLRSAVKNDAQAATAAVAASLVVPTKNVRTSIADRLAFFEQAKSGTEASTAGSKLLQKSVSDEEKTKSLQRMEASTAAPYKMNTALSSFLNDTIDGVQQESEESEPTSSADGKAETQMETSDTEEEETEDDLSLEKAPPAVPTTQPPSVGVEKQVTAMATKRFSTTAQIQLTAAAQVEEAQPAAAAAEQQIGDTLANLDRKDAEENIAAEMVSAKKKSEIQFNVTNTKENDNTNNNGYQQQRKEEEEEAKATVALAVETHKLTQKSLEVEDKTNLAISETIDNDCITKDKTADTDTDTDTAQRDITAVPAKPIMKLNAEHESDSPIDADEPVAELRTKSEAAKLKAAEDVETTERLSVVRARLQQFEVISSNNNNENIFTSPEKDNISNANDSVSNLGDKDNDTNSTSAKTKDNETILNAELTKTPDAPKTTIPAENLEDEAKLKAMKIETETENEKAAETLNECLKEVPSNVQKKDSEIIASKPDIDIEEEKSSTTENMLSKTTEKGAKLEEEQEKKQANAAKPSNKEAVEVYPGELNPFKSDDDEDDDDVQNALTANKENVAAKPLISVTPATAAKPKRDSLNPFDSSDDEIELEKSSRNSTAASTPSSAKVPPPRPPPPRISRNPFGEDTDEDASFSRNSSLSSSLTKRTPVPMPRTNLSQSQTPTPEPTPRLSNKKHSSYVLQDSNSDYYGSENSLGTATPQSLHRNTDMRGSTNSLASSAGGTVRSRKMRRAPAPPIPTSSQHPVKELFPAVSGSAPGSRGSTPSSSTVNSPKLNRKKRPAPAPPKPARLDPAQLPAMQLENFNHSTPASKNLLNYPLQSELDSKLSDEEKALLEGKPLPNESNDFFRAGEDRTAISRQNSRRLIPLDASLLADDGDEEGGGGKSDDLKHRQQQRADSRIESELEEANVVYRRVLMPPTLKTPTHDTNPLIDDLQAHDRQLEKLKDNKEAQNRNRQSQLSASSGAEDSDPATLYNKSSHGKWKRRKGPAPALPIPPRKVLQMLPLQEIRHELEIIEVQQQGLEKQGVILEKMIRDRCEGQNGEPLGTVTCDVADVGGKSSAMPAESVQNSKEVEDLILQLFELVNEKNELFRRQAELMYLRRQHRLEQEQADLEYEIRVLMAQPECNKTDSDKSREESLIARLVEVVQLRNEVVECLEMDRLREAEEDLSIKQRLELHTSKREDNENAHKTPSKLSKKEKKKQKEAKKLSKSKKIDADKDADETELDADKQKIKKKKKKFLF